jgi:catechol 2,3-dioxygenase-like lactoylglutathione lyase family enzyme
MARSLEYTGSLTLAFQVKDRKASIAWYERVLGLKLLYDVEEIGWCELSTPVTGGTVSIGLSEVETPKTGGPVPTLGVADVDAARAALEAADVRFDGETIEIPGMVKLATFFDPDGNAFMLSESLQ